MTTLRAIAETIGTRLDLPVESITPEQAADYYGAMAAVATSDLPASGLMTSQALAWTPTGTDVLSDLRNLEYEGN